MRKEHQRRRRRKKRIRLAFACTLYFLLGAAVSAGVFLLGQRIIGHGQEEQVRAAGISSIGGASLLNGSDVFEGSYKGIIYLDAGHGGNDQGTSYQEILEKDINLEVTLKVKKYLESSGWQVFLTREADVRVDKYVRAQMANEADADVFVSIHCNFLEEGEAEGIEIYHDPDDAEGGVLAADILEAMIAQTNAVNRGVRTEDFAVTRETDMPSVLVELGYLSDADERAALMTDSYRNLLAKGIAEGMLEYLEN